MAHHIKDKATSVAAKIMDHTSASSPSASKPSSIRTASPAASTNSRSSARSRKSSTTSSHNINLRDVESLKKAKYLLQVTAGPEYDANTHSAIEVNGSEPLAIENEHIKALIKVRIKNYKGLPASSPSSSPYFDAKSRAGTQYSIGFSFVPKRDISADEATWGNEQDDPVRDRLPPGFNLAVRLAKTMVDPSIEIDGYADRPWLYAPALTSFFAWRIGEKKGVEEWGDAKDLPDDDEDVPVEEGGDGDGETIRQELGIPATVDARKKHFRSQSNRQALKVFEAGRLYKGDFFNGYIDFSDFALCLPGLRINCMRYVNDKTHRLRWVFKEGREGGTLLFCVVFTLLHGDELKAAVKAEEAKMSRAASRSASTHSEASDKPSQAVSRSGSVHFEESVKHPDFQDQSEDQKLGISDMSKESANDVLGSHGMTGLKIS